MVAVSVSSNEVRQDLPFAPPVTLSQVADVLIDPKSCVQFQAFPEAVKLAAAAIQEKLSIAVYARVSQRTFADLESVAGLCAESLPALLKGYTGSGKDPIAHIVFSLADEYVDAKNSGEAKFRSTLSRIKSEKVEPEPTADDFTDEYIAQFMSEPVDDSTVAAQILASASLSERDSSELEALKDISTNRAKEARELERELRLEEYIQETQRVLFEELEPTERLVAELYYLHSFEAEEIAAVAHQSEREIKKTIAALGYYFVPRHVDPQLTSAGNEIRRNLERQDLGLNETQGVTLLAHLLRTYPNLRRTAELLNLVADSPEFFADFLQSKNPQVSDFRSEIVPNSGVNLLLLGAPVKTMIKELVSVRYPRAENVRFEPTVATLLGVPNERVGRAGFGKRDATFLGYCIRAGFYSGKVDSKSTLEIKRGISERGRNVRNPLTYEGVVGPELAAENSLILLRRRFPNLDAIKQGTPGLIIAQTMLGLPSNAELHQVRRAFVTNGILSGRIPAQYTPPEANSAYFDDRCVPEDLEANRDDMINRYWANLDDPSSEDEFMYNALGVPHMVEHLVARAAQTLGTTIPDRHSFKYNERCDSRYFDTRFVSPEIAENNIKKALQDTFQDLEGFTYERAKELAGLNRLGRLLGTGNGKFLDIRAEIIRRGYLS